ncbi:MAG: hypothetical protein IT266_00550 [Saprospiraceae bacterium]|nr:hypothetical protein [Saprospiraceae bacterium]
MHLKIDDEQTIEQVQKKFSSRYPFLKIEFFSKPHDLHSGSRREDMMPAEMHFSECRSKHSGGSLEIRPSTTVAELEKSFKEAFGLYAQVFRKSGDLWIETTVTDDWTLEKQNSEAELFYNDLQAKGGSYDRDAILS